MTTSAAGESSLKELAHPPGPSAQGLLAVVENALQKLSKVGGPEEVARLFYSMGIRGNHSASSCPVTGYLRRVTRMRKVSVYPTHTWFDLDGGHKIITKLPQNVKDFIVQYDYEGMYTRLEG